MINLVPNFSTSGPCPDGKGYRLSVAYEILGVGAIVDRTYPCSLSGKQAWIPDLWTQADLVWGHYYKW